MILIDDRIGSKEFKGHLKSPHMLTTLDYSDFCFIGNGKDGNVKIGVERKTIGDLVNSIDSGRLSGHQLHGLIDNFDYVYLLVEGMWKGEKETGILQTYKRGWCNFGYGKKAYMISGIDNYLNSLTIFANVIVVTKSDKSQSCMWLDSLYNYWQKDWKRHKSFESCESSSHKGSKGVMLKKPNLVHKVAMCFDGIGWDKGKEIGKRYKTIQEFLTYYGDLIEVKGVGEKLIKRIEEQLNGKV